MIKNLILVSSVFLLCSFSSTSFAGVICSSSKSKVSENKGCKGYLLKRDSETVLIYFRGLALNGLKGNPITNEAYNLQTIDSEISIFSTKHHTYGLSYRELETLLRITGAKKILLASHSGGWQGLVKTLPQLRRLGAVAVVNGLYLLDNFYSPRRLTRAVNETFDRGFLKYRCFAYTTPHNKSRFQSHFRDLCGRPNQVRHFPDGWHNKGVNKCLRDYVKGQNCS